jgi:diketogulonate reductase-like aldo/keto reductase
LKIGHCDCFLADLTLLSQIKPAVNQIEFHPYALPTYLPTLLPLCKEHDILIQSYAPLMSVVRHPGGPVDSTVDKVRTERGLGETAGQILLQWAQQITGGVAVT